MVVVLVEVLVALSFYSHNRFAASLSTQTTAAAPVRPIPMIKTMSTVVPMNLTVNHVQGIRNLFAYHLMPDIHYSKLVSKQHGQSSLF